jgi:ATP-binding cassette, subfamily C (CFTR/MRP), member 1
MDDSQLFSRVMEEYGTREKEEEEPEAKADDAGKEKGTKKSKTDKKDGLMQAEERLTGSVTGSVYKKYFQFGGGLFKIPVILLLLTCYQGAQGT